MIRLIAVAAFAAQVGCPSADPTKDHQETRECMTHRSMMTAPIVPDAMERLTVACERSRLVRIHSTDPN